MYVCYETVCTDMSCNLRGKIKQSSMKKKKKKVTELVVRPFCYVYIYMYVYTVILVSNKICLNYK